MRFIETSAYNYVSVANYVCTCNLMHTVNYVKVVTVNRRGQKVKMLHDNSKYTSNTRMFEGLRTVTATAYI